MKFFNEKWINYLHLNPNLGKMVKFRERKVNFRGTQFPSRTVRKFLKLKIGKKSVEVLMVMQNGPSDRVTNLDPRPSGSSVPGRHSGSSATGRHSSASTSGRPEPLPAQGSDGTSRLGIFLGKDKIHLTPSFSKGVYAPTPAWGRIGTKIWTLLKRNIHPFQ